jgi:hypothetical protein
MQINERSHWNDRFDKLSPNTDLILLQFMLYISSVHNN